MWIAAAGEVDPVRRPVALDDREVPVHVDAVQAEVGDERGQQLGPGGRPGRPEGRLGAGDRGHELLPAGERFVEAGHGGDPSDFGHFGRPVRLALLGHR
jgi:hypothetical protein